MQGRVRVRAAALACVLFGALSSATGAQQAPKLDWQPCGDAGAQCATATVPKDYDSPSKGTLKLAVAKSPATDPAHKIGSLFFNFGGPGAPAAIYVEILGT